VIFEALKTIGNEKFMTIQPFYNRFVSLKITKPVFPIEVTPVGQQILFKVTFNLYQEQDNQQV